MGKLHRWPLWSPRVEVVERPSQEEVWAVEANQCILDGHMGSSKCLLATGALISDLRDLVVQAKRAEHRSPGTRQGERQQCGITLRKQAGVVRR